jgi:hypothetical protein
MITSVRTGADTGTGVSMGFATCLAVSQTNHLLVLSGRQNKGLVLRLG